MSSLSYACWLFYFLHETVNFLASYLFGVVDYFVMFCDISPLSEVLRTNIFSHLDIGCLFIKASVSFAVQIIFTLKDMENSQGN